MSVSAISSSATTTTTTSSSSTSTSSLSSTYNMFLTVLCKQLQSQNPLDPMDTNQFTSQLVQYSSVEQQIKTNDNLSKMLDQFSALTSSNGVAYIGHTVQATGDTNTLTDGSATWSYNLGSAASDVTLTLTDSEGKTVWTGSGDTASGQHTLNWDGKTTSGTQLADGGNYTLSVSATDSAGASVATSTAIRGKVTGVDTSSGSTELTVGDVTVALDTVSLIAN